MSNPVTGTFSRRVNHLIAVALLGLLPVAGATVAEMAPGTVAGQAAEAPPPEAGELAEAASAEQAEDAQAEESQAQENVEQAVEQTSTKPHRPQLRAGINEQQLQHAMTIVETGQEMGLPRRAYVVAIATALQESRLSVLANVNVPHSFDYQPRDGYGRDHDSVGIFQHRVKYYCVNDLQYCMDPRYSAMKFYQGLRHIDGWEELPVTVAAQRVQRSAFPDYYAKHQGAAELIVDAILEWQEL